MTFHPAIFSFLPQRCLVGWPISMPVNRTIPTALSAILCLCALLRADTVTLKSGDKVEGKILRESDAEVTLSVQVTATIRDERVIKRDEIASIEKVQPDEEAWAPIANLAPGNESYSTDEYGRAIAALDYFLKNFPQSTHVAMAKQRLDQFSQGREARELRRGEARRAVALEGSGAGGARAGCRPHSFRPHEARLRCRTAHRCDGDLRADGKEFPGRRKLSRCRGTRTANPPFAEGGGGAASGADQAPDRG